MITIRDPCEMLAPGPYHQPKIRSDFSLYDTRHALPTSLHVDLERDGTP